MNVLNVSTEFDTIDLSNNDQLSMLFPAHLCHDACNPPTVLQVDAASCVQTYPFHRKSNNLG